MRHLLVRQAMIVPLAAMLVPILIAFWIPGYSSVSQHISETALLDHPIAFVQRAAAIVAGLSMALFGLGVLCVSPRPMVFTSLITVIAGIGLASNGVFVMGSPLHGLYGIGGFALMLVPAFFAAEVHQTPGNRAIRQLSLMVAFVSVAYIWSMIARAELVEYRGLFQRAFTVLYFGWYTLAGFGLLYRSDAAASGRSAQS